MLLIYKKSSTWNTIKCIFTLADVYNVFEEVKLQKHNSLLENRTSFSDIFGPYLPVPQMKIYYWQISNLKGKRVS